MQPCRLHIVGGSGSETTTLGRSIAKAPTALLWWPVRSLSGGIGGLLRLILMLF